MKKISLKFFGSVLFIIVLGILSIPSFNIQIRDTKISFPQENSLEIIGKDFTKGFGIYPTNKVIAKLELSSEENISSGQFKNYLNKIQNRILISGLTEISVKGIKNENGYFVHIDFSQNYDSPDFLAKLILTPGEFVFIANSEGQNLDLNVSDFASKFGIAHSNQVLTGSNQEGEPTGIIMGTHLVNTIDVNKNPSLFENYKKFVTTSQSPIFVLIDDLLTLYLFAEINPETQEVTPLVRLWGMQKEFENSQVKLNSYKILSSFLSTEPLEYKALVNLEEYPIANSSENQYTTSAFNLAIGFSIIILVIFMFAFIKLKLKRFGLFKLFFLSGLFAWTFLIKFLSISFNIYVLVGFLLYLILLTFFCVNLSSSNSRDEFNKRINEYKRYTLVLIFTLLPMYLIGGVNLQVLETLTSFLVGLLIIWFFNKFNFKFIFENYFK